MTLGVHAAAHVQVHVILRGFEPLEVRAFDAITGALKWTFHPLPGELRRIPGLRLENWLR